MVEKLITAKMTPDALSLARLIAATTGERQYEVFRRVLEKEAKRLGIAAKGRLQSGA
jgi:hypothetical protein